MICQAQLPRLLHFLLLQTRIVYLLVDSLVGLEIVERELCCSGPLKSSVRVVVRSRQRVDWLSPCLWMWQSSVDRTWSCQYHLMAVKWLGFLDLSSKLRSNQRIEEETWTSRLLTSNWWPNSQLRCEEEAPVLVSNLHAHVELESNIPRYWLMNIEWWWSRCRWCLHRNILGKLFPKPNLRLHLNWLASSTSFQTSSNPFFQSITMITACGRWNLCIDMGRGKRKRHRQDDEDYSTSKQLDTDNLIQPDIEGVHLYTQKEELPWDLGK